MKKMQKNMKLVLLGNRLLMVLLILFFFSCKSNVEDSNQNVNDNFDVEKKMAEKQAKRQANKNKYQAKKDSLSLYILKSEKKYFEELKITNFKEFLGQYIGDFKASGNEIDSKKNPSITNKINISIDEINTQSNLVKGHSIVAGNLRHFKGEFYFQNNKLKVYASEPGNNKYDGTFNFTINLKKLKGTWQAKNEDIAVKKRYYDLEKKSFFYNKNLKIVFNSRFMLSSVDPYFLGDMGKYFESTSEAIAKINASTQKLTSKDLENLYKGDLEIIRNAIYARHGYSFKNRKMRYFFDRQVDWYIPVSIDVRNQLTKLELENIELIKRYEEHAEKYYDYFGR